MFMRVNSWTDSFLRLRLIVMDWHDGKNNKAAILRTGSCSRGNAVTTRPVIVQYHQIVTTPPLVPASDLVACKIARNKPRGTTQNAT